MMVADNAPKPLTTMQRHGPLRCLRERGVNVVPVCNEGGAQGKDRNMATVRVFLDVDDGLKRKCVQ